MLTVSTGDICSGGAVGSGVIKASLPALVP